MTRSKVRPHDAVCAIYRGRQLVVGGDPKQLPPTDFFTRTGEDGAATDETAATSESFESLLDVCLALGITRKRLRWHYRSRREGLEQRRRQVRGGTLMSLQPSPRLQSRRLRIPGASGRPRASSGSGGGSRAGAA